MRPDLPSRFEPLPVAADAALTPNDMSSCGLIVAQGSGSTITLPSPARALNGVEAVVVNNSSGAVALECTGGFVNSGSSVSLASGAAVLLYCTPIGAGSFAWASIGATAS